MRAALKLVQGLTILSIAAGVPAMAQVTASLPDATPATLVINTGLGGWTVTISGCQETFNGAAASCTNDEVIASVSAGALSLAFEANGGGALETSASGVVNDVTFNMLITAPGHGGVAGTTNFVAGSAPGFPTRVSASETVTTLVNGVHQPVLATNLGTTLLSQAFSPISNQIGVAVDLKADALHPSITGTTVTLNSATFTYTTAPEPISSSILGVGLAGISFVRWKKRRLRL
jgi:hypothetical protein